MLKYEALESVKIKEDSEESKFVNEVLYDFWICCISREVSLVGRREVLTGKAKFGILGDGKEVPQVAMARAFKKGDWRSGYYRDQTFMFATGLATVEDFFAQLYADPDNDPFSGGRQMNSHYSSPTIDQDGKWLDLASLKNISSDVSCTGGQMGRGIGLALASKLYKQQDAQGQAGFSKDGNEVCFVTIGDASTSEGAFWETMNAAGVHKVPMAVSVWDDGYGISVPVELQTTKGSISKLMEGFHIDENGNGIYLYTCKGWDYAALCEMYERGIHKVRKNHIPALFHIQEITQPQGHSTSGSHERYKSADRLEWEKEFDGIERMAAWMISSEIASQEQINEIKDRAKVYVREAKQKAWTRYYQPIKKNFQTLISIYGSIGQNDQLKEHLIPLEKELKGMVQPLMAEVISNARRLQFILRTKQLGEQIQLNELISGFMKLGKERYTTHLYSNSSKSALKIPVIAAKYDDVPEVLNGYQILNKFFDAKLGEMDNLVAFGEDVGGIGDVNQGFAGLQAKYGTHRVFDSGIREWTIMGLAIGLSMRGFRPIAEIQYLDYIVYGLSPLCDDLATLRYRSNNTQHAPAIIRTRGHRLEGIWHAGSPMGMLVHALRGMYICVPRNMVQAAGMYNTLLKSDDPALVVECLNGYRLKEKLPQNMGEYTVPLGVPEILISGKDLTLVTYGSCVRIAIEAIELLAHHNIQVELIDVQTLLPFDLESIILTSVQKTNRLMLLDEDVPGGATAYMLQDIMERQGAFKYLDSVPTCISANAHRCAFGSDGDYFSKPNVEDVFETTYNVMRESNPDQFPML